MLAVLHRNCGPREGPGGPADTAEWGRLWEKKAWDKERLDQYFEKWKESFDLFHEKYPFYQTLEIPFEKYETTAGLLSLSPPYRSHPTLFDHGLVDVPPSLSPAEAALLLVAQQAFAYVNLVTYENKEHKSAKAASLVRSAVVLNRGSNLFETLMLNLHAYNPDDEEPFHFDPKTDKPAWERSEYTRPSDRLPDGYLDWLTWQSRRVRLKPTVGKDGKVTVCNIVIMKGFQLPKGKWRRDYETMIPFRANKTAKKEEEPWPPVQFEEDKSLWRDSLSLLQSIRDSRDRPRTVDWIADLKMTGALPKSLKVRLAVFGLSADQSKPEFWRREELPLDVRFYDNEELVAALSNALRLAERSGDTIAARVKVKVKRKRGAPLEKWLWGLGYVLMLPEEPAEISEEQEKGIKNLEKNVAPSRAFWPHLETPFKRLLEDLPDDTSTDENGSAVYGAQRLPEWAATVRRAAQQAFDMTSAAVGESARALKARAKAESVFRRRLNSILKPDNKQKKEGGEEA
jgi:CRISPR system Cascade subunit CasA